MTYVLIDIVVIMLIVGAVFISRNSAIQKNGIGADAAVFHIKNDDSRDAARAWTHETGKLIHEFTLACDFDGADKATMYQTVSVGIKPLDQSAVSIEESEITMEFYCGE